MASLEQILTPDKTKVLRYATYFGHEGVAGVTTDRVVIFRTAESLWTAVANLAELVVLGAVSEVVTQHALDRAAGDLVTIATHRRQEVA